MSDAKVTFNKLGELGAAPGEEQTFGFACPNFKSNRCEGLIIAGRTQLKHDPQGQNGGIAQWNWNGSRDKPTFTPSIKCGFCKWHGFIENGRCVNTAKQDEPEVQ
jgi:hypothetical protein